MEAPRLSVSWPRLRSVDRVAARAIFLPERPILRPETANLGSLVAVPSFRIGRIPSGVARKGAVAAGVLALLMAGLVVVGILLPGTVDVTRSIEVAAPPERVFPLLNDLSAWDSWTPWAEIESRMEGPPAGLGARRVWDDPRMGSGSLTITASVPPSTVSYEVELEDGAIRFEGTLSVASRGSGSLVTWTERADFGWNPLLGWTALGMEESQGRQLEESLARLREQAEASR